MMKTVTGIILCSCLFLFSCTKEKATKHDYPKVATGQVSNINAGGATFNGSFLQAGTEEITDHGFVFGTNSYMTIQSNERISLGPSSGKGSFSAIANYGMVTGKTYYVSAYARNKNMIFYADPVSFVSKGGLPPEILHIVPGEGIAGDTVTIKGKYFGNSPQSNDITFNNKPASIISASDTEIVMIAPASEGKEFADIFVTVAEQTVQKTNGFRYLKPEIIDFWPRQGVIGDTITITGKYFSSSKNVNIVAFNNNPASIISASNTELVVSVPSSEGKEFADIFVTVDGQKVQIINGFQYMKPEVTGLSPMQGTIGDIVTINGQYFSNNINDIHVYCEDFRLDIMSCSENQIVVTIPNTAASAKQPIRVRVDDIEGTSAASFEIISPWTKKAAFPTTVNAFPIFASYNNEGYVIDYSSWQYCWKYIPDKDLWQMITSNIGNFSQNPDFFQVDNLWFIGFIGSSIFSQISLESFQRKELSYPPQGIMIYTFSFIIDGKAYVCGGYDGFHFGNTVRQFDAQTEKWTIKASLSDTWRNRGVAFSYNGKGYAGWGAGELGNGVFTILNDFYEFDPQTNIWTQKTDFPGKAVSGAISFVVDGRIFAGLGIAQEGNVTESIRDIWEYHPDNDTWTHVAIIPNNGGEGAYVFVINNKAYIGGGHANSSYNGHYGPVNQDFYEFDPSKL